MRDPLENPVMQRSGQSPMTLRIENAVHGPPLFAQSDAGAEAEVRQFVTDAVNAELKPSASELSKFYGEEFVTTNAQGARRGGLPSSPTNWNESMSKFMEASL
jgi:hypothetical protein